jgi:hypothetical protein
VPIPERDPTEYLADQRTRKRRESQGVAAAFAIFVGRSTVTVVTILCIVLTMSKRIGAYDPALPATRGTAHEWPAAPTTNDRWVSKSTANLPEGIFSSGYE